MRFLADESCDFAVVRALIAAGHDITLALQESRILLTEDKDFGQLVFASGAKSPGVVLIRFPAGARSSMIAAMTTLVATHADRLGGRFVVVEPGRVRISGRTDDG